MKVPPGPMGMWLAGIEAAQMMAEAQTVIALRVMGMAGLWAVPPTENRRMVAEKPAAFARAAMAAGAAAMAGQRPDEVLSAAIRPLRKATRANSRRLSRPGTAR